MSILDRAKYHAVVEFDPPEGMPVDPDEGKRMGDLLCDALAAVGVRYRAVSVYRNPPRRPVLVDWRTVDPLTGEILR